MHLSNAKKIEVYNMNIEDINKECKKLSKKQSYIKKALFDFIDRINKELETNNADINLHIKLSAWEQNPNFPNDFNGEFGNNYHLVLEDNKFSLQLNDTEYYNQTGSITYDDIDIDDISPVQARKILLELPKALETIKNKLNEINAKYEKALLY